MSINIDPKIKPLTRTHLEQMLSYCDARDRDPWYYGNKQYFEKRHKEIMEWIEDCLERLK